MHAGRWARRPLMARWQHAVGVACLIALTAGLASAPRDAHATPGACSRAVEPVNPIELYGDSREFDIQRNGRSIGRQTLTFRQTDEGLHVDVRMQLEVRILGIVAYRYSYASASLWHDGCLVSLDAETNDDGDVSTVSVRRERDELVVDGPNGVFRTPPDFFPTNHWNAGVIGSDQVINTISGRISNIGMDALGEETIIIDDQSVLARHFRYTGDLKNEVWYDEKGRWVWMRFEARDGSTIDYVCQRCLPPMSAER